LKYTGLIIPNSNKAENLSKNIVQKRYNSAIDYVDLMEIPNLFTNISLRILVDGAYYGIIVCDNKKAFSVMDLPFAYCRSRFKDENNNDIIEFNVSYFLTFSNLKDRQAALESFPTSVASHFKKYEAGKVNTPWIFIPTGIGISFKLFDCYPLFLNVIPATI